MLKSLERLSVLVSVLLAGCTVASAQLPPPPSPAAPAPSVGLKGEIEFAATNHDFGKIWDHEKVSYDFVFRNVGTEDLTVLDVKSTCGCTVPELEKKVYAPGEEGAITVIFNPQNRQNKQNKTINVTTDSRATPRVALHISSFVTKVLDIQPSIANLGRIYKNEEKGVKVFITGSTPDFKAWPAEELSAESPFKIEVLTDVPAPPNAGENGWTVLRVYVEKGLPVGRHNGEIVLKTNDSRRPEVQLRSVVTVVGDLQARPPRFALGRMTPGESFEATVTLLNRVAEEFEITKIVVEGEADGIVKTSFSPTSEGKKDAYDLTVTGIAPEDGERVLGRVVIHTNMADEPTFELPVYGFVSSPPQRPMTPTGAASGG